MFLLDTDILIWVLRGNNKYEALLQELKNKAPLAISTITIAEIYSNMFPSEVVKTENVIQRLQTIDVTTPIAKQAGAYIQQYSHHLKTLSLMDCLIAATASVHDLTLVTLNRKHFPMKDITLLKSL